tara:strand:- start:1656 stop:2468 length:813 start_codon:yes stop_codon:yes gene_type:complete
MAFMDEVMKQLGGREPDLSDPQRQPPPRRCAACGESVVYEWKRMVSRRRKGWWVLSECASCSEQIALSKHLDGTDELIASANIPSMFIGYKTGRTTPSPLRDNLSVDSDNSHVYDRCLTYVAPRWIVFAGRVGVGKTTWATTLLCDLIDERQAGKKPMWVTESGFFRNADNAAATSHSARVRVLQDAIDASFLLLDDVGGNRRELSSWQGGAIRDLIDARHSNHKPTFITTNYKSWDRLAERYGEHIVSRLIDASKGMLLMGGPDRRLKK